MRVEYEQICASDSGHIRRAAGSAQYRDLAEEMPCAETKPLLRQIDLDLAGRDEIHGMRQLSATSNYSAGLDRLRAQEPHDVGDLTRVKVLEQRHAGHHAPRHHELTAVNFARESSGHDAYRQRNHDESSTDRHCGNHASKRCDRNNVTVTDRSERDDRPPHRVWDGAEFIGLRPTLGHMHHGGGNKGGACENDETAEQSATFHTDDIE